MKVVESTGGTERDGFAKSVVRPPGLVFYLLFGVAIALVVQGATEPRGWLGMPSTPNEVSGMLGWALVVVLGGVYAIRLATRFVWAGRSGELGLGGGPAENRFWFRWLAVPIVISAVAVMSLTEVVPRVAGHVALSEPGPHVEEARGVIVDTAAGIGLGGGSPRVETAQCSGYEDRDYETIEAAFPAMSQDEGWEMSEQILAHWEGVASERGWRLEHQRLSGDDLEFRIESVRENESIAIVGTTPCTRR